jgi:hypothetical protein
MVESRSGMAECRSESPHWPAAALCHYPADYRRFGRVANCPAPGKEGEPHSGYNQQRPGQGPGETDTRRHAVLVPGFVDSPGVNAETQFAASAKGEATRRP